jgi:hypothetical protein
MAERVNDLLLPIVKGVGSERSYELLAPESPADPRRLGLPAGLPDRAVHPRRQDRHPLRGHHRDPGPGLLLPQDGPDQFKAICPPRRADHRDVKGDEGGQLAAERELLGKALEDVQGIVGVLGGWAMASQQDSRRSTRSA